jgi:hypothetical protein
VRNDLSAILIGACLIGALWTTGLAAQNRRVGNWLLIELAVTEVLVLVQLVVAVVLVISGSHPDSTATFLSYAVGEPVILPIGVLWSQAEKSRSSTLVIAVACLALAVMTVRMLQMWSTVVG